MAITIPTTPIISPRQQIIDTSNKTAGRLAIKKGGRTYISPRNPEIVSN